MLDFFMLRGRLTESAPPQGTNKFDPLQVDFPCHYRIDEGTKFLVLL